MMIFSVDYVTGTHFKKHFPIIKFLSLVDATVKQQKKLKQKKKFPQGKTTMFTCSKYEAVKTCSRSWTFFAGTKTKM